MFSDSEIMTKTIQAALAPLLIIAFLCGLAIFEYPLGRSRLDLTFLYLLTTWSLYIYLFYYVIYTSYTTYIYMSWLNFTTTFLTIVSIFVSLFHFKVCIINQTSICFDTIFVGILLVFFIVRFSFDILITYFN